jgi:wyosine [tRNA(Phe)-imidazoG37] synthetase (radical SAM superfamily)
LKLDTVDSDFISQVDRPVGMYDVQLMIERMKAFGGHLIIQTMFLKGNNIDNTTDYYVGPWLETVKAIAPRQVMVYTIDRETPAQGLEKFVCSMCSPTVDGAEEPSFLLLSPVFLIQYHRLPGSVPS